MKSRFMLKALKFNPFKAMPMVFFLLAICSISSAIAGGENTDQRTSDKSDNCDKSSQVAKKRLNALIGHLEAVLLRQTDEYGNTLLHLAVLNREPHVVQELVDKGYSPHAYNDRGETPLRMALKTVELELIKPLIRSQLKAESELYQSQDENAQVFEEMWVQILNKNPLNRLNKNYANYSENQLFMIDLLLSKYKVNLGDPVKNKGIPIILAYENKLPMTTLRFLLNKCREQKLELNIFQQRKLVELASGDSRALELLYHFGIHRSIEPGQASSLAVQNATRDGDIKKIRELWDRGADLVNAMPNGMSCAHYALVHNSKALLQELIRLGVVSAKEKVELIKVAQERIDRNQRLLDSPLFEVSWMDYRPGRPDLEEENKIFRDLLTLLQ